MKTIYGECVSGSAHASVRIFELAREGCRMRLGASERAPEGDLALWIGAIGPLHITAARDRGANSFVAHFREPLEPAILAHFNV